MHGQNGLSMQSNRSIEGCVISAQTVPNIPCLIGGRYGILDQL
jgi:hypothetical protein